MVKMPPCSLRALCEADLEKVLSWRNRPEVRRVMLNQHEIQLDEHRRWFANASSDPARRLLIAEATGTSLGFVHFSGVAPGGVSDWGFYAAEGAPRGSGSRFGGAAINYAFSVLSVHKVCAQVLASNEVSLRLHRKLGFVEEGVLRDQYRSGENYQDLICFGLLRHEWCGNKE